MPSPLDITVFLVRSDNGTGPVGCAVEAMPLEDRRDFGDLTVAEVAQIRKTALSHSKEVNPTTRIRDVREVTTTLRDIPWRPTFHGLLITSEFVEKGDKKLAYVFASMHAGYFYRSQCVMPWVFVFDNQHQGKDAKYIVQGLGFLRD